jgi:hypothetical protein
MKNDKKYTITSVSKSDNTKTDIQITPNFREYSDKMVDNPIFISFSDNPMEENGYGLTLGAAKRLAKNLNEIVDSCHDEILDDEEKKYLRNIIKPFKDDINYIMKKDLLLNKYNITINVRKSDNIVLPNFDISSPMYKNMQPNKLYTLQELNLI